VDASVLELDRRIEPLSGLLLELIALAARQRPLDDLVFDALLVERLLHLPAGMRADLHPHARTAVELDGHARNLQPSGTLPHPWPRSNRSERSTTTSPPPGRSIASSLPPMT